MIWPTLFDLNLVNYKKITFFFYPVLFWQGKGTKKRTYCVKKQ